MVPRAALLMLPLLVLGCVPSEDSSEATSAPAPVVRRGPEPDKTVVFHENLSMDIYRPKSGKGPFPAVLLLHGGGWSGGNRQQMAGVAEIFAAEGIVAVTADYRLAPRFLWPAQREDVAAAVAYLRDNAKELDIRPDGIGASGVSAGGHLSSILGTVQPGVPEKSRVQAVGSISGIHDLNAPMTPAGDGYGIIENLMGEKTGKDVERRKEASPATYVDAKAAPTMFVCGGKDGLVPRSQSELIEKKLKAAGVAVEILDVPDMGHVPEPDKPDEAAAMRTLARWMKAKLGG